MPKVSVISPVYNVEPYIGEFLESMKNQTFQDFELILVYDGSTDKTLDKMTSFINSNSLETKYKVIENKIKKGVGFARDLGFKESNESSEYVIFLDPDDYVDKTFLEKLVSTSEEYDSDVTICGYKRFDDKTKATICEEMINNPKDLVTIDNPKIPLAFVNSSSWNKLYKREVLKDAIFGEALYAEDLYHFLMALKNIKTIKFINEPLYFYRIREGSLINTISKKKFESAKECLLRLYKEQDNVFLKKVYCSFVFVRIGVGSTLRLIQSGEKSRVACKTTKQYLKEFLIFKKNELLSLKALTKGGKKGFAMWIVKIAYKIGFVSMLMSIYTKRLRKTQKEIRW